MPLQEKVETPKPDFSSIERGLQAQLDDSRNEFMNYKTRIEQEFKELKEG